MLFTGFLNQGHNFIGDHNIFSIYVSSFKKSNVCFKKFLNFDNWL